MAWLGVTGETPEVGRRLEGPPIVPLQCWTLQWARWDPSEGLALEARLPPLPRPLPREETVTGAATTWGRLDPGPRTHSCSPVEQGQPKGLSPTPRLTIVQSVLQGKSVKFFSNELTAGATQRWIAKRPLNPQKILILRTIEPIQIINHNNLKKCRLSGFTWLSFGTTKLVHYLYLRITYYNLRTRPRNVLELWPNSLISRCYFQRFPYLS